jgi:hypothetical protein
MEKEFISYTEALALKKLGFDEEVEFYKDLSEEIFDMRTPNDAPCILWQQAFRWFREKHGWISNVWTICISTDGITSFEYAIDTLNDLGVSQYRENFPYKTYEEAELACLKELIEIVKNK